MKRRKSSPPELAGLRSVQLVLDLPQTRIKPGSRVLILDTNKTGRVSHICFGHCVCFPGGKRLTIARHLLVEIQ